MAYSENTSGEGSGLTEEDRLGIAEVITQQQQPREEPVGDRVDSSEDDMDENDEGEGDQPRMSPIRTLTKLLLMA